MANVGVHSCISATAKSSLTPSELLYSVDLLRIVFLIIYIDIRPGIALRHLLITTFVVFRGSVACFAFSRAAWGIGDRTFAC
jgi:hypothetical protein